MSDGRTLVSLSPSRSNADVARVTRDGDHQARTVRAIRNALTTIPFYAKQGLELPSEDAPLADVLAKLPLLTPAKIRPTLPKSWVPEGRDVREEMASGKLSVIDAGASDARVRLLWDAAWWKKQETRGLTVNAGAARAIAGELGRYRDAVLWIPERGTGSCGSGDPTYEDRLEGTRLHLNSRQDPAYWTEVVMTRMLDELAHHETVGLLADPYYLDALARHATSLGRRLEVSGFVGLMRALPTAAHRAAIGLTHANVIDVYSAREAGILFVQDGEGVEKKMHHAPLTTHVELLRAKVPTPGAKDVALVVVTTLDREVQPLVRYVLGDLVQIAEGPGRFTTVSPIASVEGKLEDAVVRPDGAIVTPAAIDRALAPVGLRAYQVMQSSADAIEVDVVGADPEAVREALAPLTEGMRVTTRAATAIAALPNGKYRSSQKSFAVDMLPSFEATDTTSGARG